MPNARTKISNWVYRISLTLLIIGTLRLGQFVYDQFVSSVGKVDTSVFLTALVGAMNGTMALGVAALAMAVRSGAVVWILGMQFVGLCLIMAPSFMNQAHSGPMYIAVAIATVSLIIGTLLFTYLIRKTEIRAL
ncbi:hypothetical protein [Loktanella sp. Alg231-35]|uniref:hypothetical protein n=1 Tax=Loktanella sp. Alg231-35 TaxID=1922220 RepID=UPI000D55E518|nr:hypothetical protein [Loktanella sp. Alg231-35]